MAFAETPFHPHVFSNAISSKLTDDNFLTWMQHAEAMIKGFYLQRHIDGATSIPAKFLTTDDERKGSVNAAFENYEQQDNLLKSWLLESIFEYN
uniref:Retrotransposon Copia-like N-terminal domain-containing protein n=1 Tax=Cajanus cajan TaxID=3821 RepID=A0A151RRT6_CAJCA|nr:hypothetical protein KK1_033233 [Cajanus cajan]